MADNTYIHDPDDVLDYTVDWETWLDSDTLTVSAWTIPTGLTEDTDETTFGDSTATVWLSGGTAGKNYNIVNHITTAAGRETDQTLVLFCREK